MYLFIRLLYHQVRVINKRVIIGFCPLNPVCAFADGQRWMANGKNLGRDGGGPGLGNVDFVGLCHASWL